MSNSPIIISSQAELDIRDAYEYYEKLDRGLGSEFIRAIDACLSKIGRNPLAYSLVYKTIRRALIRRFPYGIFYIVQNKKIIVIGCFHAKQNPKTWQDRKL